MDTFRREGLLLGGTVGFFVGAAQGGKHVSEFVHTYGNAIEANHVALTSLLPFFTFTAPSVILLGALGAVLGAFIHKEDERN